MLRLTTLLILLVVTTVVTATVLAADNSRDEQEILRLHHAMIEAWQKNDIVTLNAIIGDDFQFWSFKGERRNNTDLLKLWP